MEAAHQVVALQHATHVQGQCQRHGHRQALGHSHDDERHSHHEVVEHHMEHAKIVVAAPHSIIDQDVVYQKEEESGHRHTGAYLADELGQTVKLDVQGGLHVRLLRTAARHPAYLRRIAHRRYTVGATTVHHHRRTQQHVRRIGTAMTLATDMLMRHRLARQRRFVHLQRIALQQHTVGRNLVASLDIHRVTDNDITAGHRRHLTIAQHLHRLLLV